MDRNYLVDRFERQLVLKGWSLSKQQLLAETKLVVPSELQLAAMYAAAAGVGQIGDDQNLSHRFSVLILKDDPTPEQLEKFNLVIAYQVESELVRLRYYRENHGMSSIERPCTNFVSSLHLVSLLAISILINEVINS